VGQNTLGYPPCYANDWIWLKRRLNGINSNLMLDKVMSISLISLNFQNSQNSGSKSLSHILKIAPLITSSTIISKSHSPFQHVVICTKDMNNFFFVNNFTVKFILWEVKSKLRWLMEELKNFHILIWKLFSCYCELFLWLNDYFLLKINYFLFLLLIDYEILNLA